ncbi:fasciclin domain-containing protein [Belliella marina]|uniref:Fasciclin domain-containing protein n=1 Tax=Belliella marina TaxID=1644146 RepID=A0ABW4VQ39_9BACT
MTKNLFSSMAMLLLLFSCKEFGYEEHYKRPEWLRGNAWEVLEEEGQFGIFLEAVERSGFASLVEGKGVITVMAPTDDAFKAYLQKMDLNSIDQLSSAEIRKLVGYHLVYYAFDKQRFANYQPEGSDFQQPASAGFYFKHRTKSRDTLSVVFDPVENRDKKVFHKERFLPVLSSYHFNSKSIDAQSNYEYFYPGSTWTGQGGGFNVSNASVTNYGIPTDNGYIHIINQVIEPLETVHKELQNAPDYSSFISIYDRFRTFWYDEKTSADYAAPGDSLFVMSHTGLPQIASEWSYNGEGGLPDYANLPQLSGIAFNVFAPNNSAMTSFFNEYWAEHYTKLSDVNFLPLSLLLNNHVYRGSVVFPSEISRGSIRSSYGNVIQFDPYQDVKDKKICSNGVYYGLESVVAPPLFHSVAGPLLKNPANKMFLQMAHGSNVLQALNSDALDFTVFVASDDVVSNTIYGGSEIFWDAGHPLLFGDESVQVENSEGILVPMSQRAMALFVENHIVSERITEIGGKAVYRTRNPFSYLYVTDQGVASSNTYNLGTFVPAVEIEGPWINGKVYSVETSLIREEGSFKYIIATATSGTSTIREFSEFSKLLAQAGLININDEFSFLFGDNYVLFAPTNEAILQALEEGLIPTDQSELARYLQYYFVPVSINSLNDYPFPGFGVEGEMLTSQLESNVPMKIKLIDKGNNLQLQSGDGSIANVVSEFPKIYMDGAVYQIDRVLKSQ